MSEEAELTTEELRTLAGDDLPEPEEDSIVQPPPEQENEAQQEHQPPPGPDDTPAQTER